ncbi:hypothetical protein BDZ45DRAFT_770727, partial [Acephala macrosclerotiorum]
QIQDINPRYPNYKITFSPHIYLSSSEISTTKHHYHQATMAPKTLGAKRPKETGGWVYTTPAASKSGQEKSVIASGYPWVSISTLYKDEQPLGFHSHHSDNTHLIIKGETTFHQRGALPDRAAKFKAIAALKPLKINTKLANSSSSSITSRILCYSSSEDEDAKDEYSNAFDPENDDANLESHPHHSMTGVVSYGDTIPVKKGVAYGATVVGGRDGMAKFIEGHEVLSPTTRDRLLVRGDIKWEVGAKHVGEVQKEVKEQGNVTEEVLMGREVPVGGSGEVVEAEERVRKVLCVDSEDEVDENLETGTEVESQSEKEEEAKRKIGEKGKKGEGVDSAELGRRIKEVVNKMREVVSAKGHTNVSESASQGSDAATEAQ